MFDSLRKLVALAGGWFAFVLVFLRLFIDTGHAASAQHVSLHQPSELWFWLGAAGVASLALFLGCFALLRKARVIEDMPTSRIRSAAQGYVELEGHARVLPGPAVVSPLSRQPCAWWSYTIRHYDSTDRKWHTVESETSGELFVIADTTGECIVDPEAAQVTPSLQRSWRGRTARPLMIPKKTEWISFGDYAYSEKMIRVGDFIYAAGLFRTQGAIQHLNEDQDVRELLAQWKRDQRELLSRFDSNQDGRIDLDEWEAARRAAQRQVRDQHLQETLHPDIHVLSKPRDRRPFILSALGQDRLVRRYRGWAFACLVLSLALAAALLTAVNSLH